MTRSTLRRTLRRVYATIVVVLAISLVAKFVDHIPIFNETGLRGALRDLYEYLRDMSLLIATAGVAYVADVYQKRSSFIDALKEEWRDIIAAKSAVFSYTQLDRPTLDQYLAAFCKLSETIDNMRSVYQNVGETDDLIGLYPYAPLHDMRRALQTLDPRKLPVPDADARNLARDAILQSFYALRETFLEELDLEAPDHPLLISGGRRKKASGSTREARSAQTEQRELQSKTESPDPRIDAMLGALYDKEQTTTKPWRQPAADAPVGSSNGRSA